MVYTSNSNLVSSFTNPATLISLKYYAVPAVIATNQDISFRFQIEAGADYNWYSTNKYLKVGCPSNSIVLPSALTTATTTEIYVAVSSTGVLTFTAPTIDNALRTWCTITSTSIIAEKKNSVAATAGTIVEFAAGCS